MLTRLEIDGFKNLRSASVDFGPFTCIAGPNGVGKSNLFDAIEFLSLLAQHPIMEAAQRVRRSDDERSADPRDLFWTDGRARASTMRFAAEMIVPASVRDAFGREAHATITFLRYELELGYAEPSGLATMGRLVLLHEQLKHINIGDARRHLRFPHKKAFRDAVVRGRRSGGAFISTVLDADGRRVTRIHQDGASRGQPRPSPTEAAPMTIVGTTTQASDPTILAARRAFEGWRMLALEPAAMRSPDRFRNTPRLEPDGGHLAATLYRLATTTHEPPDPEAVYARIARRLAQLLPVDAIRVERDDKLELLTVLLGLRKGPELPARSLSDGTLRFLALCLLDADHSTTGLLCMEEPENGIHPARIPAMVDLVRDMAVDPHLPPGADNPMRQVIVNTHSPLFVQQQRPADLLMAVSVGVRLPSGHPARVTRFVPISGTWRCDGDERGIPLRTITDYLQVPANAQVPLLGGRPA